MTDDAPVVVGNHRYSAHDARRCITEIGEIWREHRHLTDVPDGWLAGARGFVAEAASLGGVALPPLEDVDAAFATLAEHLTDAFDGFDVLQVEALVAAMWRFLPTMRMLNLEHTGTVAHLHASRGLPKKSVDSVTVGWSGIEGDVQRSRKHHGAPYQALCIWSLDSIARLQAEGHPIDHGFAGENITVSGVPNGALRPGAHFEAGTVRGFLTGYAYPCNHNTAWFADGDFMRMWHERGDDSRTYAMVTRPGTIAAGDVFRLYTDR
ncbi:MAG: MOSC domain-containing protein [Acidimicrobiales bacterium]